MLLCFFRNKIQDKKVRRDLINKGKFKFTIEKKNHKENYIIKLGMWVAFTMDSLFLTR